MPPSNAFDVPQRKPSDVRTVAIIQARMGSKRLPGKVLADVAGRPIVAHVIDRASRMRGVDEVVVAIPNLAEDDILHNVVAALGVRVVRGDATDVLGRYVTAIGATRADVVVRITADCPMLSPSVGSEVLAAFDGADYASNTLERTHPRGLDTEVIRADALIIAAGEATDPFEREHVTPYVWRRPERFRLVSVRATPDRSALRWTVDVADDLAFVRAMYAELGHRMFDIEDAIALLEARPDLIALNDHVVQNPMR